MIRAARTLALPGLAVLCTLGGLLLLTSCGREKPEPRTQPAATSQRQPLQVEAVATGATAASRA